MADQCEKNQLQYVRVNGTFLFTQDKKWGSEKILFFPFSYILEINNQHAKDDSLADTFLKCGVQVVLKFLWKEFERNEKKIRHSLSPFNSRSWIFFENIKPGPVSVVQRCCQFSISGHSCIIYIKNQRVLTQRYYCN